jgi:Fur family iron response transcriptional regulator
MQMRPILSEMRYENDSAGTRDSAETRQARIRLLLERAGVRCTRQRLLLASIVFEREQHLSADQVMALANRRQRVVSKATVYNTLGLFARMGLVREVIVDPQRVFYDSNVSEHHHIYNEDDGTLTDVDKNELVIEALPTLPPGTEVHGVEVIVRVRGKNAVSPAGSSADGLSARRR